VQSSLLRKSALLVLAAGCFLVAPAGTTVGAADGPKFNLVTVGPKNGGGEPSIVSSANGELLVSYPGSGMDFYRSGDFGKSWSKGATADAASGDTCVTTDQSNAIYQCNLAGSAESLPLQADVFKSLNNGNSWTQGAPFVPGGAGICGASCSPFGVDRQWTAAWIPPGKTTAQAEVALMYHDFVGPSQIWVNMSNDGGATFGAPSPILANPALTPSGLTGAGLAQFYSLCNTIPSGVYIEKSGPHIGRIILGWIAADPVQNATGCNVSMAQSFHTLWVAWSDDGGATWTPQLAFDGGIGHDASTPFVGFTLDNQGNPYFGFADNLNSTPACAVGTPGPSCEYDMYVVSSPDGGATWGTPLKVNTDTGTHFMPAIAVGDPGHVSVAYLHTASIIPTDVLGKATPGGGAGDIWNLVASQINLKPANAAEAGWAPSQATVTPMHIGDICNLGIACVSQVGSNRSLLDFISETLDVNGCAHIAYTDDNTAPGIRVANQVTGCGPPASTTTAAAGVSAGSGSLPGTSTDGPAGPGYLAILLASMLIMLGRPLGRLRRRSRPPIS
jgi:hypothetical protein